MKSYPVILSLVLLLPTLEAQAQWRSVHATQTTAETFTRRDGSIGNNGATGEYFRSTSGSELSVVTVVTPAGLAPKKLGELYDNKSPAQYSLDYDARTAFLIVRPPAPKPFQTNRIALYPNLQHAKYAGLDCLLVPVMMDGKRIGTVWVDDADDLEVKKDITYPDGGTHTVMELSNISFDGKTDPSMFQVPATFRVDTTRTMQPPPQK